MRAAPNRVGCMPLLDGDRLQLNARRAPRGLRHSASAAPAGDEATITDKAERTRVAHATQVAVDTGMRKTTELLRLRIEHVNFGDSPAFFNISGKDVEVLPGSPARHQEQE